MEQDNSPQSARGQLAIAAQIAESKRKQRESALFRSKTDVRRTSTASTQNSQVTERPPQVYQAPQMNTPEDFHEVAKLVHGEFEKIAQSQSVLLSLWQKLSHMRIGDSEVSFGTGGLGGDSPEGAGIELGWSSSGETAYIDFHVGMGTDYDARIRVDKNSSPPDDLPGRAGLEIYALGLSMTDPRIDNPVYLFPNPTYFKSAHSNPYIFPIYTLTLGASDNLNNFDHTNAGIYHNNSSANATTENNYPTNLAGILEVIPASTNGGSCVQRYQPYTYPDVFYQRVESKPGVWSEWMKFTGEATTIAQAVRAAKREIYAELLELNAGIVVPVVIE